MMDPGWWVWLLKNTTASFSFLLLLPVLFARQGRQPSSASLAPFGLRSRILTATYTSVVLHLFDHYAFSSTTPLTVNLNFPFLIFFHVTVSFGALSIPFTLVFTPFQHQQGVLMVRSRRQLTGLYYSLHILFVLRKSQASSSIYSSLFWTISLLLASLSLKCPEMKYSNNLLDQTLHAVPTVSTIKEPLILISSQVVTLMAVLDSPESEVIFSVLSILADLLLFAFIPSFTCVYQ